MKEHYSYAAYADPEMARTFDASRFGGPIGAMVAGTQARVLANMVGRIDGRPILDVGTGTGRAALLFARGGAVVTAVDASEEMLAEARRRAAEENAAIRFQIGDAHALDFSDRSYDVVVSLRVIMHAPEWRRCLAEFCRVADRLVIFDYPSAHSFARLESFGRRIAHKLGARTQPYQTFTDTMIDEVLERNGFRRRSVHRQFVLPIAFHKLIGSPRFTDRVERGLDRLHLLELFGSPVTIVAERCVF